MKKKIISALLMIAMLVTFVPKQSAHADVLLVTEVAGAAYAAMTSWGVDFAASSATGSGMQSFMEGMVTDYVNQHGGDITSLFAGSVATAAAGQLLLAQNMYNGLVDFFDWAKTAYDLSGAFAPLTSGQYNGQFIPIEGDSTTEQDQQGLHVNFTLKQGDYYRSCDVYNGNQRLYSWNYDFYDDYRWEDYFKFSYSNNAVEVILKQFQRSTGLTTVRSYTVAQTVGSLPNSLNWKEGNTYTAPQTISTGQSWTGTVAGSTSTTAGEIAEDVFTGIAGGTLSVTGTVGSSVQPTAQPTAAPTNPPATPMPTTAPGQNELDSLNSIISQNDQALQGINDLVGQGENVLDSLNDLITSQGATAATVDSINDLLGQYEGVLDGINDLIGGDDGVLDGVTDIGGSMSEALEGINDLLGQGEDVVSSLDSINTGVGSMTDAIEGVNDAVGALEQSLTDALSIPTAAEATQNANALKFDLRTLFPFCIPFDVYRIINIFNASPVTPRVRIPFNIPAIGLAYTFNLDLSDFDGLAAVLRNVELVAFCVGLAIATRKFIRW